MDYVDDAADGADDNREDEPCRQISKRVIMLACNCRFQVCFMSADTYQATLVRSAGKNLDEDAPDRRLEWQARI